ncbi:MAG TPA: hypothetical protein VFH03_24480 [Actinoplanes sp.]|nr:hypothetical protein [Actinoplanes sp.]
MTTTTLHPAPATGDPYARIARLDEATVATLADRIELRAGDPASAPVVARLPRPRRTGRMPASSRSAAAPASSPR